MASLLSQTLLSRFFDWLQSSRARISSLLRVLREKRQVYVPLLTILNFYLFLEFGFYLYYRNQKRNLQWHTRNFLPPFPKADRERAFSRLLGILRPKPTLCPAPPPSLVSDSTSIEDGSFRNGVAGPPIAVAKAEARVFEWGPFLSGWFFGAPAGSVHRKNIAQFLAYAFFSTYPNMLSSQEKQEVRGMIDRMEAVTGQKFPPGLNPAVKCMRLTLDPLLAVHRPLLVYGLIGLMNVISRLLLRLQGFKLHELGGFRYWFKPARNPSARAHPPPLVFMHGLGQGLLTYIHFLYKIDDRPIFLMEFPYVSMRVWEHIPTPRETVDAVETMLLQHNFSQAVFMGHSFGTFCVAWCIKYRPRMVHSAIVIDPVCLLLFLPITAYSFIHEPPTDFIQAFIRYIATRELGIARFMARAFCWHSNMLLLEDTYEFLYSAQRVGPALPDLTLSEPVSPDVIARGSSRAHLASSADPNDPLGPSSPWTELARHHVGRSDSLGALPERSNVFGRVVSAGSYTSATFSPDTRGARTTPIRLGVFLAGKDPFVPCEPIIRYFKAFNLPNVTWVHDPNLRHAGFLFSPSAMDNIIRMLHDLDREQEPAQ